MNIINKLTLRYLKQNKKRTIFTILSIALSITMINAVGISLDSIMNFYKDTIVASRGSFHYRFISDDPLFFEMIEEDSGIKDYYYTNTSGYVDVENNLVLSLKKGDSTFYEKRNVENLLIQGELPLKPNEIVLESDYLYDLKMSIGDTITLAKEETGERSEFRVVGFIDEYKSTHGSDSSFNALTYVDLNNGEYYTISIEDKDLSKNLFSHSRDISQKFHDLTGESINLSYNSAYLGSLSIFEEGSNSTFIVLYGLVAIILGIIVVASVIIIYQAFDLSTHDKIQYLGMLSSVGATPRQKRNSVFFEGVILTLIALPIGFICSYVGMFVTFSYINTLEMIKDMGAVFHTTISLEYLLLTIALSIMTVFLSLVKPAVKLSRITVIDALKKDDEIKVKKNKLKVGFLQRKLMKYDQQLAVKNYKRQGKRSKVIIFSLVLSMVLFVSIYSFSKLMYQTVVAERDYSLYDVTLWVSDTEEEMNKVKEELDNNDKVESYYYYTVSYEFEAQLNLDYFDEVVGANGYVDAFITVVDDDTFKKICEDNDIEFKGSKQGLVSYFIVSDETSGKEYELKGVENDFIKEFKYSKVVGNNEVMADAPLFDSIDYIEIDNYNFYADWGNALEIIVPFSYFAQLEQDAIRGVNFCIKAPLHAELTDDLIQMGYNAYDVTQSNLSNIQSIQVFQIFIYGFICLMILFTMLNIVNMMSASIDKRKKEFSMLLSVGMSHRGIKKMIFNESLIYGLKTFIYALPLCIFVEYIMYLQVASSGITFTISYLAYVISFIVIMVVMLITFKIGLNKLNKQNIIETLKDDI